MPVTRPDAVAAWSRAAAIPDGPGWHQGQEQLRSWIGQQIADAAQSGELDPNNKAALSSFLGTLGVTPEKGGGRYIYRMFMGDLPTDGWAGNAALARYAPGALNAHAGSGGQGGDNAAGALSPTMQSVFSSGRYSGYGVQPGATLGALAAPGTRMAAAPSQAPQVVAHAPVAAGGSSYAPPTSAFASPSPVGGPIGVPVGATLGSLQFGRGRGRGPYAL